LLKHCFDKRTLREYTANYIYKYPTNNKK
jgi:hypothetical protein